MSSESCPKTCSQLSTAAILISIGIVQLLAGIILLKADDICLLAGTDFVAAASNVFVGSMLGLSASIWEKKKTTSTKNSSRQNVLAGLYITALTLNSTIAIIMIMGDGNKLLTEESGDSISASLVFEVLACAYVTSVCSPIVCLVISLVCLSGNRIKVQDRMKKAHSITKSESYGWVYDKNIGVRPKNLEELLIQFSANQQSPVSDDNVFLEKKSKAGKLSSGKKSKPNSNSISSVREVLTPLEVWAQKRKKILQEITTPKPMFFSDDYLRFPEFKYGSYAETMIPRIKRSSVQQISQNSSNTPLGNEETRPNKMQKAEKSISCNPTMLNLDELNVKLAARRMSYPDCTSDNTIEIDSPRENCAKETSGTPYNCKLQSRYSVDGIDILESSHLRNSEISVVQNENLTTGSQRDKRMVVELGHDETDGISNEYTSREESFPSKYLTEIPRQDSTRSVSGLTSETICELKAKINRLRMNDRSNSENRREFLGSFKNGIKKKSNLSESDIDSTKSQVQNSISHEGDDNPKTSWAGDVVPISIQSSANPNISSNNVRHVVSPSEKSIVTSDQINSDRLKSPPSEDVLFERATPPFRSLKEKLTRNSTFEYSKCASVKHSERQFDFTQRSPFMGSIAESPIEETERDSNVNEPRRESAVEVAQSKETTPKADTEKSLLNTMRRSFRASPNTSPKSLLNRLWSIKRSENKAQLSSVIMDTDSLVGLSEEELLDRTRRMRMIRKSVILRSKDEKKKKTENQQNENA